MKPHFTLVLLSVLAAGCVAPQIQTGNPQEYEFQGLKNTTFFYLNVSSMQVVESVINTYTVRVIIGESGEMNFRDPIAVDYSGNNVSFNVSKEIILGRSYALFEFSFPFSGFVAFTQQSDGQDFSTTLTKNGSVRVVLPVNFTTGSRFLGIVNPKPDNITIDSKGREVFIWEKPYPKYKKIEVKYYHMSAPMALFYFFIFLFICVIVISGYYYVSLRALKKKRNVMEKGIRK